MAGFRKQDMSEGAVTLESVVGWLLSAVGLNEPDWLELTFYPGALGSQKRAIGDPVTVTFRRIRNPDRVRKFFFSRRRWKPSAQCLDQLVEVARRTSGTLVGFAQAGRLMVEADEPECVIDDT